jgi:hypothetical protein
MRLSLRARLRALASVDSSLSLRLNRFVVSPAVADIDRGRKPHCADEPHKSEKCDAAAPTKATSAAPVRSQHSVLDTSLERVVSRLASSDDRGLGACSTSRGLGRFRWFDRDLRRTRHCRWQLASRSPSKLRIYEGELGRDHVYMGVSVRPQSHLVGPASQMNSGSMTAAEHPNRTPQMQSGLRPDRATRM